MGVKSAPWRWNCGRGHLRLPGLLNKARAFYGMSLSDRMLFIEAFVVLGIARAGIALLSFKRLVAGTKSSSVMTLSPEAEAVQLSASRIGRTIGRAARHTPWNSACLCQGLTARWMLRRRGIRSSLMLGATMVDDSDHGIAAHAWTVCGDCVVTGLEGCSDYNLLACFTTEGRTGLRVSAG